MEKGDYVVKHFVLVWVCKCRLDFLFVFVLKWNSRSRRMKMVCRFVEKGVRVPCLKAAVCIK